MGKINNSFKFLMNKPNTGIVTSKASRLQDITFQEIQIPEVMWIPSYQTPPKYDFYLIHKCTRYIEIRTHVKCTIHKLFPNIKTLSSHVSLSFFPLSSLLSPLCLSSLSKIQCIYPIHKIHFQHERINTILLVKRGVYHLLRS